MPLLTERRLGRIDRAVSSGKILPFLAFATIAVTAVSGFAAWLLAPGGFEDLDDALWWAAQTVTTVGYGDVVPESGWGRVIGLLVMAFGVAAVSLITALVTSAVVAREQRRLAAAPPDDDGDLHQALSRIHARLEAIEQRLSR